LSRSWRNPAARAGGQTAAQKLHAEIGLRLVAAQRKQTPFAVTVFDAAGHSTGRQRIHNGARLRPV
jgi:hypothetical protein